MNTFESASLIPTHEDGNIGKIFQWMVGDNVGLCDVVKNTVRYGANSENDNFIFESGIQMPISDVIKNMIPLDVMGEPVPEIKHKYKSNNLNIFSGENLNMQDKVKNVEDKIVIESQQNTLTTSDKPNVSVENTNKKNSLVDTILSNANLTPCVFNIKIEIPFFDDGELKTLLKVLKIDDNELIDSVIVDNIKDIQQQIKENIISQINLGKDNE